jgi:Calcium-activated chloride channel
LTAIFQNELAFNYLVNLKVDIEAINYRGWTPLQLAPRHNEKFDKMRRDLKRK